MRIDHETKAVLSYLGGAVSVLILIVLITPASTIELDSTTYRGTPGTPIMSDPYNDDMDTIDANFLAIETEMNYTATPSPTPVNPATPQFNANKIYNYDIDWQAATPKAGDFLGFDGNTNVFVLTPVPPTAIATPTPINSGQLPNTPIWNALQIYGVSVDGGFPNDTIEDGIMVYRATSATPKDGEIVFVPATELTPAATPTLIPTAAPPTPAPTPTQEIPVWGTATPVASAGDQRWNTDYQVMEQYNGSAWWPTGPLVQIDWAFYEKNPGDAFIFGSLDYGYPTTYYTTGPCLIYAVDASVSIAPGSGKGFTYTVSAAGTPIPSLAATITGTGNAGVDTCTYFYCAKNTAITIAITVTGTPDGSDAQHAIKLYAVRRP